MDLDDLREGCAKTRERTTGTVLKMKETTRRRPRLAGGWAVENPMWAGAGCAAQRTNCPRSGFL